ncbi:MAG: carbamoyl-phosphate synthase large subunit [Armatimonadota bacterium]
MPKKTDISRILVIGSGPIVIGQGGAFDYMAAQACRALREEGYEIVVANSNPSTIVTDPGVADRTYIEPLTVDSLSRIIEVEKPDALLATVGGQTALNLAMALDRAGILAAHAVKLIGTDSGVVSRCEDRSVRRSVGATAPVGRVAHSMEEGMQIIKEIEFPAILRPACAIGGAGSAVTYNMEEFGEMLAFALKTSPAREACIEKSFLGCKGIGIEVMRDCNGRTIVVAGMENIDPTGIHTGDSTTVFPIQTLSADQIESLFDLSRKIADAVGVVGSMSIQFALDPGSSEVVILEVDPRATRSTALASKVAGFPIAKVSAKLAVGIGLDEIEVAGKPCAEFAASGDYVAVKMSRFAFEKFPGADTTLNTSMKSVGEAMAFGRSFKESLQKAIRSLEIGRHGLGADGKGACPSIEKIGEMLARPSPERLFFVRCAVASGISTDEINDLSKIDPWFIEQIRELVEFEKKLEGKSLVSVPGDMLREAKQLGYSDAQLAKLLETEEDQVRTRRKVLDIRSGFDASGGLCYSTYDPKGNCPPVTGDKKVIILGGGPNRIGQGVEFDYCCANASAALMADGFQSIIINCNPEAVSTDPEMSGRLYFEPLTGEDVLDIIDREKPMGVLVQFGGRTAQNLSAILKKAGVATLGTSLKSIDRTADRMLLRDIVRKLGLTQTDCDVAASPADAAKIARKIGYPVLARPGRALDGRATQIIYDDGDLSAFVQRVGDITPERPLVFDKFIEGAVKVDVDAVSDSERTIACGVMEHIEQAGVHSGDSACSLPPYSLSAKTIGEIKRQTALLAAELGIRGLTNAQFAAKDDDIYVLGVNPQASRMIPFVCKATGVDWVGVATRVALGKLLREQGVSEVEPKCVSVKEAVFPFTKFPGVDVVLGPEMKSTGEVMGINESFGNAYIKAEIAAGQNLPEQGTVFLSVADIDKDEAVEIGKKLRELGFEIVATRGTAKALNAAGLEVRTVSKIGEGRPDATDLIKNEEIDLIINTPSGKKPRQHEITIRSAIVARGVPIITTIAGAKATVFGMETVRDHRSGVRSLQDYS